MQKVLITGGNKGIGLETTKLFIKKGEFKLYIIGRDFTNFPLKDKPNIKLIQFDLRKIDEVKKLEERIGVINILINNSGILNALPYDNYPIGKKDDLLQIHLEAPVALITESSKSMVKQGGGRIVNVSSIAGEIGHPDIWYGISKAGLINATKSFAKILGSKNIIINTVAPGPVETEMLKIIPEERKKNILKTVVSGRYAKPQEIAQTIFWLATESPSYINGVCIDINNTAYSS